ncbi:MAG: type II secretion system secretin GspD [Smithellaceae bacterium]
MNRQKRSFHISLFWICLLGAWLLTAATPLFAARVEGETPSLTAPAKPATPARKMVTTQTEAALERGNQPIAPPESGSSVIMGPGSDLPAQTATPAAAPVKKNDAQKRKEKPGEQYVTLDFDNVNIEVFVKFVSELTGKNFIIDDKVRGKVTILSPKKIPLSDVYKVFLSVLEINGFATVPVGDLIKVVPSAVAREKSVETRSGKGGKDADDRIVTQIIALERANPDEVKRVLDPIVPRTSSVLSYPPAGVLIITDYLSNIRRLQDIIRFLDVEGAGEQITYVPLKNASASEVVRSLMTIFQQRRPNMTQIRLVADSRTNSVIIFASIADTQNVRSLIEFMDKDVPRGESNIQVYRLQNSVAEDLAKVLTSIVAQSAQAASAGASPAGVAAAGQRVTAPVVSRNVQVVPDKATNTLVIMAEREDYKIIENIIQQLDVPRAMVYIEALIMEVNANKDFKLGVEWRGIKDTGSIEGIPDSGTAAFVGSGTNVIPNPSLINNALSMAFPAGFSMGIIGAGIKIGGVLFPTIGAVVQAYKYDSDVSILSTPQLMTLDNEEAEISVGSNVPYITRQDSTATTAQYPVNYNTYDYKDVGVVLNITPNINEEGVVRLRISQEVTKVTAGADKSTPTTLKRTVKTTIVVKDKETVVIGGLIGDSTEDGTNKVPLLGDIPLLGWLFKAKTTKREKTNLYVFLTPHIVRSQQEAASLYQSKRESMGEVVEGIIRLNDRKRDDYPTTDTPPVLDDAAPKP